MIWLLSVVASALEFHSPIGAPITLNIFAVAVFFWLEREVLWANARGAVPILEWFGRWSYSTYLMHLPIATATVILCRLAGVRVSFADPLTILVVLFGCYLFYRLVEDPSHRLAKTIARLIASRRYTFKPL
jgi:peptidoglycan/LPS O-acetylase OafA/YrhL